MRYDLCSPRKKSDGGTWWHKIGTMFPSDKEGFSIILDSLPLPDAEGKVIIKAFEPRDKVQPAQRQEREQPRQSVPDSDSIPF